MLDTTTSLKKVRLELRRNKLITHWDSILQPPDLYAGILVTELQQLSYQTVMNKDGNNSAAIILSLTLPMVLFVAIVQRSLYTQIDQMHFTRSNSK